MRTFVSELITLNKEDLMKFPKEFLLTLFMSYSDKINVHLVIEDIDGLSVQLTIEDLYDIGVDSGCFDEFEAWALENDFDLSAAMP